ncbi:FAD-dependent oxidoreductase [Gracilibacillus sp. YIM 98692]|uniref:FAD-dependent oxidoreductase n=1 Tax=Gracilibacillus sp. YIM 98692 TaxID=2663532 RepID=UPI001F0974C4|nr:FAD-dependent oxidoreductase [Gracilibacillus sp. YIM 98692]
MEFQHVPLWQVDQILDEFPSLQENKKTEVTIVGAGITGITTAYLLAKKGVKVIVIDRDKVANGTTGNTTAKVTAQHGIIYDEFIQHFGEEKALQYYRSQIDAIELIQSLVQDHDIDCQLEEQDAILYTNNEKNRDKLEKEYKAYQKLGIKGEEMDRIPFSIPAKYALKMKQQAQFHPIYYLKTLVDEIKKNGGEIYQNTVATDIENGAHSIVRTINEQQVQCNIVSNHVVIASHFPFYEGTAFYSARMYPSRSYIVSFTSEQEFPGGMYLDIDQPKRSLRTIKHNNQPIWLLAGEAHKTGQYKNSDTPYKILKDFAKKHLEPSQFHYEWSAQDYTTLDKIPYIGRLNKDRPEILVATGYRKWGMTNSTVAAKLLSDLILEKDNPYTALYQPTRFHADPDLKKFTSINTNVASKFIQGKLTTNDRNKTLQRGSAIKKKQNGQNIGIYKDENDELHAVDTTCTHLGCELNWNDTEKSWDCPCHGSRFTYKGRVIEGPAIKDLDQIHDMYEDKN